MQWKSSERTERERGRKGNREIEYMRVGVSVDGRIICQVNYAMHLYICVLCLDFFYYHFNDKNGTNDDLSRGCIIVSLRETPIWKES